MEDYCCIYKHRFRNQLALTPTSPDSPTPLAPSAAFPAELRSMSTRLSQSVCRRPPPESPPAVSNWSSPTTPIHTTALISILGMQWTVPQPQTAGRNRDRRTVTTAFRPRVPKPQGPMKNPCIEVFCFFILLVSYTVGPQFFFQEGGGGGSNPSL
jgi:hypothetical protein